MYASIFLGTRALIVVITAIPILQKHAEFLIDRHAYFSALEPQSEELGELFSTGWTREAIAAVVAKGYGHLTKVCCYHSLMQYGLLSGRASKSGSCKGTGNSTYFAKHQRKRGVCPLVTLLFCPHVLSVDHSLSTIFSLLFLRASSNRTQVCYSLVLCVFDRLVSRTRGHVSVVLIVYHNIQTCERV